MSIIYSKKDLTEKAKLIAHHIELITPELKLINVEDYIYYINNKKLANLREIIDSATELHFIPLSLVFNQDAQYSLDETNHPIISLSLRFQNMGWIIDFVLGLLKDNFAIKIHNIYENSRAPKDNNFLRLALQDSLLKKRHK